MSPSVANVLSLALALVTTSDAVRRKNALTESQRASEEEMRYYASQENDGTSYLASGAFILGAGFVAHRLLAGDVKESAPETEKTTKPRAIPKELYVFAFCVSALIADSFDLIDKNLLAMATFASVLTLVVRVVAARRNSAAAMMKPKKVVD
eukprot:TRINITY_DN78024_c0_g1_i1.p1 TRINITY_DN78024_c0_g1~~TRINITY_DN78024_c0_g1_i1.p1  ORF type:complete len:173 (+),score=43.86 TRINITY_DN78024_c0_g1_i1:66-521(+)